MSDTVESGTRGILGLLVPKSVERYAALMQAAGIRPECTHSSRSEKEQDHEPD